MPKERRTEGSIDSAKRSSGGCCRAIWRSAFVWALQVAKRDKSQICFRVEGHSSREET